MGFVIRLEAGMISVAINTPGVLSVLVVIFSLVMLTCTIDVVLISLTKVFTAGPTLVTGVPEVITSFPLTILEDLGVVIVVVIILT